MADARRISTSELAQLVERIFLKAGLSAAQAAPMARVIAAAERDACKSHGIHRVEGVLRTLRAGKVSPDAAPVVSDDGGAIIRVDAEGGFAFPAFDNAAPLLADRARSLGISALVVNNCVHITALWPEVERLTELGLAALSMCPSYSSVAPFGGTKALLGTNPIAFGWPRPGKEPYVFDFATSVMARGEIELYERAGKQLPEGWAIDVQGEPTRDPTRALEGAMLPFGSYKGSAIATMIELLAGAMIGDLTSPEALVSLGSTGLGPTHGALVIAFSPERFAGNSAREPFVNAEALFDAIVEQGARLPSQRRFSARSRAEAEGIALSEAEMVRLEALAATVGLSSFE